MSEWQPIETAPKDETWVLAAWADHRYWHPVVVQWARGRWTDDDESRYREPTHWMPLPAPPPEPQP